MQKESSEIFQYISKSAEETQRMGIQLGKFLQAGDVICLQGELGAGKTTFVQGVARGWGALDPVSSPTFILVNTYHRSDGDLIFHLDTYRLESIPEAEQLDLDSMNSEGTLLIEWPERLGPLVPTEHLWIEFTHLEDGRQLNFKANGSRYQQLLNEVESIMVGGG